VAIHLGGEGAAVPQTPSKTVGGPGPPMIIRSMQERARA
jgi:hypothetical protein